MSEMAAAHSHRLFFALWPTDALRERLAGQASELSQRFGGRPIPSRNLHVTVLFLGEVASPSVDSVLSAAGEVRARACEIGFDQVETWPGANVLCLTSANPPAALEDLSGSLRRALSERGFEFRQQKFRPHITLARNLRCTRTVNPVASLAWPATEFALIESNMTQTGSQYSVRARWLLDPPMNAVETG